MYGAVFNPAYSLQPTATERLLRSARLPTKSAKTETQVLLPKFLAMKHFALFAIDRA